LTLLFFDVLPKWQPNQDVSKTKERENEGDFFFNQVL
jgi:hypothetical protein